MKISPHNCVSSITPKQRRFLLTLEGNRSPRITIRKKHHAYIHSWTCNDCNCMKCSDSKQQWWGPSRNFCNSYYQVRLPQLLSASTDGGVAIRGTLARTLPEQIVLNAGERSFCNLLKKDTKCPSQSPQSWATSEQSFQDRQKGTKVHNLLPHS